MKTAVRYKALVILVITIVLAVAAALLINALRTGEADPHEGQVYINDGFGMVWMTPLEGVDVNTLGQADFRIINGQPYYSGSDFEVQRGIDVSEHQLEIDWAQVASADVDFAFIRLGYRGYTEGGLFEDAFFQANMKGAIENGLKVGVYFFSQATSVEEATEEAEYVLERIADYDVSLPVVFDWEKIEGGGARTDGLDTAVLDDCALAFCETVKAAGYEPCIYFNRHLGYYGFDLSKLTAYKFWAAVPGDFLDFYYACDMWQYSFTGSVPGISTETDMNLIFTPVAPPTPDATGSPAP
ncbi:MAG: glycoside hydrolase family 25 protein [Oscillospiraceae bacterium]|nr:glycoside hydrolase family 25 protein [Oscillospiraceae bacterium]